MKPNFLNLFMKKLTRDENPAPARSSSHSGPLPPAVVTENLDCTRSLSAGELIKAPVQQRCNGVLDRKAGSAEKNPAWLATKLLWFIRRTEAIVAEDRLILSGVALVSVMKSSDLRNHYDAVWSNNWKVLRRRRFQLPSRLPVSPAW